MLSLKPRDWFLPVADWDLNGTNEYAHCNQSEQYDYGMTAKYIACA